ncbi:ATP synthase F1 subunit delta [bacterium]|nr:ATP synthase F1 subunit delta [bacterium]
MNLTKEKLIAKRWATSLAQLNLSDEVDFIIEIFRQSSDLKNALNNPIISNFEKNEIIDAVFKENSKEIRNFLKLLIEKKRFMIFDLIVEEYTKIFNKMNNITELFITSAIELKNDTKNTIENKISKKLNTNIKAHYIIDKSIIAGLVFKIGDNIIDSSFKNKIQTIEKELTKK